MYSPANNKQGAPLFAAGQRLCVRQAVLRGTAQSRLMGPLHAVPHTQVPHHPPLLEAEEGLTHAC